MTIDTAVHVTITMRSNSKGLTFTEIRYVWEKAGRAQYALTRVPWLVSDSVSTRVHERLDFIRRQNTPCGVR